MPDYFFVECFLSLTRYRVVLPTEETAIAKGIRRIVGLTGAAALNAQGTAAYLQTSLLELEARRSVHASLLPVEDKITALRYLLLLRSVYRCTGRSPF